MTKVITSPPQTGHRESDDSYHSVICSNGKHRVIICKDHIQWILQERRGMRYGEPRWEGIGYFTTRAALLRSCHLVFGECLPNRLLDLPAQFQRGQK